jgi:hypothetical protein
MKILINCLVFGKRPLNIIADNLNRKGFECDVKFVDVEGIANALNEGIAPSHEAIVKWLNLVADRFEQAPEQYAAQRNMQTFNESLLLENNK